MVQLPSQSDVRARNLAKAHLDDQQCRNTRPEAGVAGLQEGRATASAGLRGPDRAYSRYTVLFKSGQKVVSVVRHVHCCAHVMSTAYL